MNNEYKFRTVTSPDWEEMQHPDLVFESGLRLKATSDRGVYISQALDSGQEGRVWHRLTLDADIPENATLGVSFYASETETPLQPYPWSAPIDFTAASTVYDALIPRQTGRYLRLRIAFEREEDDGPVVRLVKAYYPRLSYLRYLPAFYRDDSASREFLEGFLSVFESPLHDIEETITGSPRYLDPDAAPPEFVPWLATWLSLDLYDLLGEGNRKFIKSATGFYKQKGTLEGIASLVTLLTGFTCCIKEYANNVFRSYGMEHVVEYAPSDGYGCAGNYRRTSTTVDTADLDLLSNIGTLKDEVHYVADARETGLYSSRVIGIFITISERDFIIDKDQLIKILNSFLPVFVRAEIFIIVEIEEVYSLGAVLDTYGDDVDRTVVEQFSAVGGDYENAANWTWMRAFSVATPEGRSNDTRYRTPHSLFGTELAI